MQMQRARRADHSISTNQSIKGDGLIRLEDGKTLLNGQGWVVNIIAALRGTQRTIAACQDADNIAIH